MMHVFVYAVEFRGDHVGHRDTQVAILEERGAKAPESLSYDFPGAEPGDAFVRQALEIEVAAQLARWREDAGKPVSR